jgi:hypothetical protein
VVSIKHVLLAKQEQVLLLTFSSIHQTHISVKKTDNQLLLRLWYNIAPDLWTVIQAITFRGNLNFTMAWAPFAGFHNIIFQTGVKRFL